MTPETATRIEEPVLTAKLSPKWALGLPHVIVFALWGAFVLVLNYVPTQGPALWSHIVYGQWILEHQALPLQDPIMPLAEGMRAVDSAWLAQVIVALVDSAGSEWLSHLFALTVLAQSLLLAGTYYQQSQRLLVTTIVTFTVLLIAWPRLVSGLQIEHLASLCFAGLLCLIVSSNAAPEAHAGKTTLLARLWAGRLWIGVPVLFLVWANLHGSFVWGLAVLACFLVGRVLEVAWRTRSWHGVLNDRTARCWLYLGELGLLATLINPYGFDLWLQKFWFADHRNLRDIADWQQLAPLQANGWLFALSIALLLVMLRHSRHRVPAAHGLLLAVFTVAALAQQRLLSWYGPVLGLAVTPHLADIFSRLRPVDFARQVASPDSTELPPGRSWRYSLFCLLVVWLTFAFSGLGQTLMGNKVRSREQLVGRTIPLGASSHFRENTPQSLIFSPHQWADWFVYDGPADLKPFVTSQVHLVPRQVWQDYGRIAFAQSGWDGALDRYRVDTIVVDKRRQETLHRLLRTSGDWETQFEDEQAVVFHRRPRRSQNPPSAPENSSDDDALADKGAQR